MTEATSVQTAGQALGQSIRICHAATAVEIERAFDVIVHEHIGALCVTADPVFLSERDKAVALAARHGIPAIYADREIAEAGGLISYGASRPDAYRQAGIYVGRILKGEKPSNLPVIEPTTFELVINLKTAKGLGLAISPAVLLRANHIIE